MLQHSQRRELGPSDIEQQLVCSDNIPRASIMATSYKNGSIDGIVMGTRGQF